MSGFGFKNFGHFVATIARDVVRDAKALEQEIPKILAQAGAAEPVIEAVTAGIDPAAVVIERAAFAVLGSVLQAVEPLTKDAVDAAASKGLSIPLDVQTLNDLKALVATFKAKMAAMGVKL